MSLAYIALGANLLDPIVQVRFALNTLEQQAHLKIHKVSSLYRTSPVSAYPQPDYINAVAAIETPLPPFELLDMLLAIEKKFGRKREYVHEPRTLDLDLLLYDTQVIVSPELTLPHPRMHLRAFVLVPLLEITGDCFIPGRGSALAWFPAVRLQKIEPIDP